VIATAHAPLEEVIPLVTRVPAMTVLPEAQATVNLSVFIVMSDVLEPIRSAPAHNVIDDAAPTAPVNVLAPVTESVPLSVRLVEVTGASTLPSLSTTLTSPTYSSPPPEILTSLLKIFPQLSAIIICPL
jgi:hypothetical protein